MIFPLPQGYRASLQVSLECVMLKIAPISIPSWYEIESHQTEALKTLATISSLNGPEGKNDSKCVSKLMSHGRQAWKGKQLTWKYTCNINGPQGVC